MDMESELHESFSKNVDFVNHVGLMEVDNQNLQKFQSKLPNQSEQFKLHINAPRTKSYVIEASPMGIQLGDKDIEQVTKFKYLGNDNICQWRL